MTQTRPAPDRRAEDRPFSTQDILEQTGVSFRILDYWLRTGAITLTEPKANMPGSGRNRRYTEAEMVAIRRLIDRYVAAQAEIERIRSGEAWSDEFTGEVPVVE